MEHHADPDLERNLGTQPLDQLLFDLSLRGKDLVSASSEQITHKMVIRARKGRRLSRRVQDKILRALLAAAPGKGPFSLNDLFTYRGKG
ncbi:MAG: hypothetical protein AAF191_08475 [Verrucomicrobiota bacterium]